MEERIAQTWNSVNSCSWAEGEKKPLLKPFSAGSSSASLMFYLLTLKNWSKNNSLYSGEREFLLYFIFGVFKIFHNLKIGEYLKYEKQSNFQVNMEFNHNS